MTPLTSTITSAVILTSSLILPSIAFAQSSVRLNSMGVSVSAPAGTTWRATSKNATTEVLQRTSPSYPSLTVTVTRVDGKSIVDLCPTLLDGMAKKLKSPDLSLSLVSNATGWNNRVLGVSKSNQSVAVMCAHRNKSHYVTMVNYKGSFSSSDYTQKARPVISNLGRALTGKATSAPVVTRPPVTRPNTVASSTVRLQNMGVNVSVPSGSAWSTGTKNKSDSLTRTSPANPKLQIFIDRFPAKQAGMCGQLLDALAKKMNAGSLSLSSIAGSPWSSRVIGASTPKQSIAMLCTNKGSVHYVTSVTYMGSFSSSDFTRHGKSMLLNLGRALVGSAPTRPVATNTPTTRPSSTQTIYLSTLGISIPKPNGDWVVSTNKKTDTVLRKTSPSILYTFSAMKRQNLTCQAVMAELTKKNPNVLQNHTGFLPSSWHPKVANLGKNPKNNIQAYIACHAAPNRIILSTIGTGASPQAPDFVNNTRQVLSNVAARLRGSNPSAPVRKPANTNPNRSNSPSGNTIKSFQPSSIGEISSNTPKTRPAKRPSTRPAKRPSQTVRRPYRPPQRNFFDNIWTADLSLSVGPIGADAADAAPWMAGIRLNWLQGDPDEEISTVTRVGLEVGTTNFGEGLWLDGNLGFGFGINIDREFMLGIVGLLGLDRYDPSNPNDPNNFALPLAVYAGVGAFLRIRPDGETGVEVFVSPVWRYNSIRELRLEGRVIFGEDEDEPGWSLGVYTQGFGELGRTVGLTFGFFF